MDPLSHNKLLFQCNWESLVNCEADDGSDDGSDDNSDDGNNDDDGNSDDDGNDDDGDGDETLSCPNDYGFYAHPSVCSAYILCAHGVAYKKTCPVETLWDKSTGYVSYTPQCASFNSLSP